MRSAVETALNSGIFGNPSADPSLRRRSFLAGVLGVFILNRARPAEGGFADDTLHVLKTDFERLRLDFNASRSKVRLVILLSPT